MQLLKLFPVRVIFGVIPKGIPSETLRGFFGGTLRGVSYGTPREILGDTPGGIPGGTPRKVPCVILRRILGGRKS